MEYLEALVSKNPKRLADLVKSDGLSSVNSARFNGNGLVHVAAECTDSKLTSIVIEAKLNIEERNDDDMTPVHVAVAKGNVKSLKLLLQAGADPNAIYGRSEWGPLHLAVRSQTGQGVQLEVVRTLLKGGANAKLPDADGNTPLHLAVEAEADKQLIAPLADAVNNDVSIRNRRQLTPLEYAAINGNRKAIQQLMKRGAVPQIRLLDQAGYAAYVEVFLHNKISSLSADSMDSLLRHPDFQALMNYIISYKLHGPDRKRAQSSRSTMLSDLVNSRYRGLGTFKSLLHNNVNTQFVNYISGVADAKLAWTKLVFTYILYRESVSLLKALTDDRLLFYHTESTIQAQLFDLYKGEFNRYLPSSLSDSFEAKDGISKDGLEIKLQHWLMQKSKICISKFAFPSPQQSTGTRQVFRHPALSLMTWATASGRHQLLPYLFLAEDTDNIPLALFNMTLLHRLMQARNSVGTQFSQDAEYFRLELEVFIHYLASRMWHLDKSYKKIDSALFLLQKLPTYGQATMVDLAMKAGSLKFIQFASSVAAMRQLWYRGLSWMSTIKRLMLVLSALGLWFMLLIPLVVPELDPIVTLNQISLANLWEPLEFLRFLRIGLLPVLAFINLLVGALLAGACMNRAISRFTSSASEFDKQHQSKFGRLLLTRAPGQQFRFRPVGAVPAVRAPLLAIEFLRTPVVKYLAYLFTYFIFLMLGLSIGMLNFRYVLMDSEIVYWILYFSLLLETVHQYIRAALFRNCFYRFSVFWAVVSLLSYALGLSAFSMRMSYHTASLNKRAVPEATELADNTFFIARYLFVLSHALQFLQVWRFLSSRPCIGLLIRMIEKLIKRYLLQFVLLMSLVMLRGAFIFGSLLYPQGYAMLSTNSTVIKLPLPVYILRVFVHTYYSIMGEFMADYLAGFQCQPDSQSLCPVSYLSYFLVTLIHMSGYAFYTTLLLLGLLISLVSIIVDELDNHHTAHWQLARYKFMQDINYFSLLYPPFNVLYIIAEWVIFALAPMWVVRLYDLNDGFYSQTCVINNLLSQSYVMERDREKMLADIEARRGHRRKLQVSLDGRDQRWYNCW